MCPISEEELLEVFQPLRLEAIDHLRHRFPAFQIEGPLEVRVEFARAWINRGWVEVDLLQLGNGFLGNLRLSDEYLAYAPHETRHMEPEERDCLIEAALLSLNKDDKTVLVTEFMKLTPKAGFYKLLAVKIIRPHNSYGTRHTYVLDDNIPGLG